MDLSRTLEFYRTPGRMTSLSKHLDWVRWLTDDVRAVCQVVQGLLIHDSWVGEYGTDLDRGRLVDPYVTASEILDMARALKPINLAVARSPGERVIGCCREFALLACAILRNKGVPARCRCGFAVYFAKPGYYEDHWVFQYWDGDRWITVDPQIDPLQQSSLEVWSGGRLNSSNFNAVDLYRDQYVTGSRAWLQCRSHEIDGDRFGISCDPQVFGLKTLYGQWFARGNMLRDFAALNRVETVPYLIRVSRGLSWDEWRLVGSHDSSLDAADDSVLDAAAGAALALEGGSDGSLDRVRAMYEGTPALQVPERYLVRPATR